MRSFPKFNIVRKAYCTCPPKYNLNPYLGRCMHGCLYCYAVKFPSFNGPLKPRVNLPEILEKVAEKTKPRLYVMLSDSTDPYQPVERDLGLTRKCLKILAKHGFPVLIVTKSDLFLRDLDILTKTRSVVSVTVTTLKEDVVETFEPYTPTPEKRVKALEFAAKKGLPVIVRVDPIIPWINDGEDDFRRLVLTLKSVGVRHIVVSTLKPVKGFFAKLKKANPKLSEKIWSIYRDGKQIAGYKYLPDEFRFKIISKLRRIVLYEGLHFSSCREGFPQLNTTICDGSAYLQGQTVLT
ncbi:MAG: radical SAM protein [Candidatus Bathyarchaeota archaeon]|nr:radical SAM protein [Candidatus Bathyarchaeota archaeon]